MAETRINEIGEELNIDEFESNLVYNAILKPEMFNESSRKNIYFMTPRYVPTGRMINFSFGFIPKKQHSSKKSASPQLAKLIILYT